MKRLEIIFLITMALLLSACGSNGEKKTEKEKVTVEKADEESFPEGYPEEITLPEGFTPRDVKTGEGSVTSSEGKRTYKTYIIEKMMPKERAMLVEHYKKIVEEQGWQGDWRFYDDGLGASGTFKKEGMEIEVKITDMLFTFTIKIFD